MAEKAAEPTSKEVMDELKRLRQELAALKTDAGNAMDAFRNMKAGEFMVRPKRQLIPAGMEQPIFGPGSRVKVPEDYYKPAYIGLTGTVEDLPAVAVEGSWKYRVQFPDGIGADGCLERDLSLAY